jgi:uncharacterized protein (DUF433 family)
MNEVSESSLAGVGIYTLPQAARLAQVPASSIRRWLYGYKYRYKGEQVEQPAIVKASERLRALDVVTFRDLIEIQFVHAFHREGVSWSTIRAASIQAAQITGGDHPFASQEFVTDGSTIFAEIAQSTGNKELLDLRNNQMAFRRVMLKSLVAKLDVGKKGAERLWPLGKRGPIVIDPRRQFGQPISNEEGVPTEILAHAYTAMQSIDAVARWYAVKRLAVRAAVKYEKSLAA